MPVDYRSELKRPVVLVLAAIAALGWLLAIGIGLSSWDQMREARSEATRLQQAQVAMQARGIQAVVAAGFARIFLRNCINLGLPAVESADAAAALRAGETVRLDLAGGRISGEAGTWEIPPQAPFIADLIGAGGLVPWVRERLAH